MERSWRLPAPMRGHCHTFYWLLLSCIASCYCSCWVFFFFSWVFCLGFLVGLNSVLNFTIQKCYLAQAFKKSCLTPQTGNWWWRGAVLPQLPKFKPKKNSDREESKQNKFLLVIHFSQSLILILTWIVLVVRDKLLRNLLPWEDTYHPGSKESEMQWSAFIIVFLYQYSNYET